MGFSRLVFILFAFLFMACTTPALPPQGIGPALNTPKPKLPGYVVKREKKAPHALVLVHGITGDGISSWTSQNGTYWPDLMRYDPAFDDWDIYVYEYPTSLFGECLAITDLVGNMRTHLKGDSVFEDHEHVVFLAHSMGGLVVRQFLLRYRETIDKVPMLIFFATPSAGSRKASAAYLLPTCLQVGDLRTLDVNSFLKNQQDDWLNSNFPERTTSHCAVETQRSGGSLTVERSSATLLCTGDLVAVPTNHSEIVKPDSTSDLAHIFVKNAVRDLLTKPKRSSPNTLEPGNAAPEEHNTKGLSQKVEGDRRRSLLRTLSQEYILSHDHLTPGLLAGTEWPPLDWMNRRLRDLGEVWSVLPGKNLMELQFSDGSR